MDRRTTYEYGMPMYLSAAVPMDHHMSKIPARRTNVLSVAMFALILQP